LQKRKKYLPLAPIAVEILISRGSAYNIETKSGTIFPNIPNLSAPKSIDRTPFYNKNIPKITKPTVETVGYSYNFKIFTKAPVPNRQ
jgi:hypothetical protein